MPPTAPALRRRARTRRRSASPVRHAGRGVVGALVLVLTLGLMLFAPGLAVATSAPAPATWSDRPAALASTYARNLTSMRHSGDVYAPWATPGRQILEFDPRGNGRVVEVFGDLATAERVAILVPGVDSRGENFSSGLGDVRDRAPAVQARSLWRSAQRASPSGHVAVVAWLGYDTPRGVGRDAAREELARAGADELTGFVTDLTRLRPDASISVLGHSYGSVVTGLAASHLPRQVRSLVVFGSPGMGVRRAADLHTRARLWAGRASADWIDWVPAVQVWGVGHGTPPSTPGFGAHPFGTVGVADHDHYLAPGTAVPGQHHRHRRGPARPGALSRAQASG